MNVSAYMLRPTVDTRVALRMLMPMVAEDAATTWVHVAFEGAWDGHHSGPFEFNRKTFDQIVANFEANPNPVPMDYEHATEYATHAPASGWVQKLEVRVDDDGVAHLYAFCELTQRAAEHVRTGEYRFCSGVFDFGAIDLATGEDVGCAMASLALVNTPFIRGQEPIRLSQRAARCAVAGDENMKKQTLLALMGISKESLAAALEQIEGDEITPEQLEAAAQFAAAKDGMTEEEAPEVPAAEGAKPDDEDEEMPLGDGGKMPDEDEVAAGTELGGEADAVLAPLLQATGMDMAGLSAALTANLDGVVAALTGSLDEPAAPAPLNDASALQLSTARNKVTELSTVNAAQAAELTKFREEEADRLVKGLCADGKVLHADADAWRELCLSERKTFDALTPTLKAVVPMGSHALGLQGKNGTDADGVEGLPPLDEDHPFVKLTRRNLSRAGVKDRALQDKKIREGLRKLNERA